METLHFFEEAAAYRSTFHRLHVFPFSPRPGTEAYNLDGRPPEREVRARVEQMNSLSLKLSRTFIERLVDVTVEGVIEGRGYGYTEHFVRVKVLGLNSSADIPIIEKRGGGELVKGRIKGVAQERLNFVVAGFELERPFPNFSDITLRTGGDYGVESKG